MKKYTSIIIIVLMVIVSISIGLVQNVAYASDAVNLEDFNSISVGSYHSAALKDDNTVWTWGQNDYGRLGDGTIENSATPVQVKGLNDVISVSAGYAHTVVIKKDGTVWAWGANNHGQIGDGTTEFRTSPVQVKGLTDVIALSICSELNVALKKDGTVWSWGSNYNYIQGDGIDFSTTPVQLNQIKDVLSVSVSGTNLIILKKDGTIWGLGNNFMYQLGNDDWDFYTSTLVQIKGLTEIVSVCSGDCLTVALKNDGTVWAVGSNMNGEMGGSSTENYTYNIVQIKGISDVANISVDDSHIIALKNDGTVWEWGQDFLDTFNESVEDYYKKIALTQVKGLTGMVEISSGYMHSMALKNDGTIWSWGYNKYGELGDGTNINSPSAPVKVMINLGNLVANPINDSSYVKATPINSNVMVDGKNISFEAYNIDGYTYFKIRDLAMALNDSAKQMDVTWNQTMNAINLLTGQSYTEVGKELSLSGNTDFKKAYLTTSNIYLNGIPALFTAYNIDGNNYFKLRDIGESINLGILWDNYTNTISLNTN